MHSKNDTDAPASATPDHGRRAIVHEHTLALVFHMLMGPNPDVLGAVELIADAEPLDLCSECDGHRGDDSGPCREYVRPEERSPSEPDVARTSEQWEAVVVAGDATTAEAGRVLAMARRDQTAKHERVAANLTSLAETIGERARGVSEGGNAEDDHAILGQAFAHTLGLLAQLARAQGAVEFLELDASS